MSLPDIFERSPGEHLEVPCRIFRYSAQYRPMVHDSTESRRGYEPALSPRPERSLRAWIPVPAAPIKEAGPEIEAGLDLDRIDLETVAHLDIWAALAFEVGIL